jgi:hypothetical protein
LIQASVRRQRVVCDGRFCPVQGRREWDSNRSCRPQAGTLNPSAEDVSLSVSGRPAQFCVWERV